MSDDAIERRCPECERFVPVRPDGTLRTHGTKAFTRDVCSGGSSLAQPMSFTDDDRNPIP